MTIKNMIRIVPLVLAGALPAFLLLLLIAAGISLIRRPPRRLYNRRVAETDFCPLDRIPQRFVNMIILSEDETFREHKGIYPEAIRRAIRINLRYGEIITSGSTITQQLVKNLYLNFDRNICRKLVEMILAIVIEWFLTKDEILELYLNVIYYGCGRYGITAASSYYFGKKPEALTLNQMFMLMCILSAPTGNNPLRCPENYIICRGHRINYWLNGRKEGLTQEEAKIISSYPVEVIDPELRKATDERERYAAVPMRNERFGPPHQMISET